MKHGVSARTRGIVGRKVHLNEIVGACPYQATAGAQSRVSPLPGFLLAVPAGLLVILRRIHQELRNRRDPPGRRAGTWAATCRGPDFEGIATALDEKEMVGSSEKKGELAWKEGVETDGRAVGSQCLGRGRPGGVLWGKRWGRGWQAVLPMLACVVLAS